jgi:hypothetical protein
MQTCIIFTLSAFQWFYLRNSLALRNFSARMTSQNSLQGGHHTESKLLLPLLEEIPPVICAVRKVYQSL